MRRRISKLLNRAGRIFCWTAPLLLVGQFVGNVPNKPILVTSAYLALFLGAIWVGSPNPWAVSAPSESSVDPYAGRRTVGAIFVGCGIAALVTGLLRIFDVGFAVDWFRGNGWLSNRPGRVLLATGAAWPIALGLPMLRSRRVGPRDFVRFGALVALPLLAMLATGVRYQALAILSGSDLMTQIGAGIAGAALLAAILVPKKKATLVFAVVLLAGLSLRALGLWTWQIDPSVRDMLALVESAHDSLLAGENPYQVYQMQKGSEVPLTYLPGLWLLYLVPDLFGLDIRWTGILGDAAVVASLWWVARNGEDDARDGLRWPSATAFALGAIWLFLPSVHWNGIYAEPHVWWGLLALWLASILRERWWVAAALTGLAVSTRHFGVVVLPFVLIALVRNLGWRRAVPRVALAGGVAGALLTPFVATNSHSFWFGTFRWLQEYGPAHESWFHNKFGFAGPLYEAGLQDWFVLIQLTAVGCLALGYAYSAWSNEPESTVRRFLPFAGTAYILFVMFNGIIWYSFYLGGFIFVGLGLTYVPRDAPPEGAVAELAPGWWRVSAAILAVALASGGWLGYTLYRFQSESGLERVKTRLAEELDTDDLLVDRTRRTLEFVDERGLDSLSTGAQVAEDLFGNELLLDGEPRDVWVAARTSWNRAYLKKLEALGRILSRERMGPYTLLELRIGAVRARLSRNLEAFEPVWMPVDESTARPYREAGGDEKSVWKAPGLPDWVKIEPRPCKIGGLRERLIYVHPHNRARIQMTWPNVQLGSSILLYGGIRNAAVRWGHGAVRVELRVDDETVREFNIQNRPGPWWVGADTSQWAGETREVTLEVTTADDRQRWTCIESVVLGAPDAEAP
jgi:hypothetical protein